MNDAPSEILVIGAGIVGLCVANALAQAGKRVTVVDPEPPGSQASYGNSGALSGGSVAPLAMPGVLRSSLPMLVDPVGPLFVAPKYWPKAVPWLWRFVRSARSERVQEIARALHGLLGNAVELHSGVARNVGCEHLIRTNGQLHLYPNEAAMGADASGWKLKADHGLKMELVNADAIHALEPSVRHDVYRVGYYLPEEGSIVSPGAYAQAIADSLRERGVTFERCRATRLEPSPQGWLVQCEERALRTQHVVVAAGAWSSRLFKPLGLNIPLQTQRGYHLQYAELRETLSRVVVLADRRVFINPMQEGLRIGGTVELDTIEQPPRHERARRLAAHLQAGVHLPETAGEPVSWMGHRPCLPDSMPVLGAVPQLPRLWCAFGHGHLGLTGAPQTGRWLMQAIVQGKPPQEMAPFSIERFTGA